MSQELFDEILSINSIYGETTLQHIDDSGSLFSLSIPSHPEVSIRLEFPGNYPDAPPSILGTQSVGEHAIKGQGQQLVDIFRSILSHTYIPGVPCIFDLIEESDQSIQQLGLDQKQTDTTTQTSEADGQQQTSTTTSVNVSDTRDQSPYELHEAPPWILSDVITEKKSVFVARAAQVSSVDQAKSFLGHLLATDKRVAKATHNITAWRIRGDSGVQFQDCDDDGETAAGGRLLHLLELMGVWNVMVVVTRWYGGVQLGPDRFRIINQVARDAVVQGGMIIEPSKAESGKKRGKK